MPYIWGQESSVNLNKGKICGKRNFWKRCSY